MSESLKDLEKTVSEFKNLHRKIGEQYEELTRLKKLNREMVYALNLARPFLPIHGSIGNTFKRVLAKAEGREV